MIETLELVQWIGEIRSQKNTHSTLVELENRAFEILYSSVFIYLRIILLKLDVSVDSKWKGLWLELIKIVVTTLRQSVS